MAFLRQEKKFPRNLPCPSTLGADSFLDKQHRSWVGISLNIESAYAKSAERYDGWDIQKDATHDTDETHFRRQNGPSAEIWGAIKLLL